VPLGFLAWPCPSLCRFVPPSAWDLALPAPSIEFQPDSLGDANLATSVTRYSHTAAAALRRRSLFRRRCIGGLARALLDAAVTHTHRCTPRLRRGVSVGRRNDTRAPWRLAEGSNRSGCADGKQARQLREWKAALAVSPWRPRCAAEAWSRAIYSSRTSNDGDAGGEAAASGSAGGASGALAATSPGARGAAAGLLPLAARIWMTCTRSLSLSMRAFLRRRERRFSAFFSSCATFLLLRLQLALLPFELLDTAEEVGVAAAAAAVCPGRGARGRPGSNSGRPVGSAGRRSGRSSGRWLEDAGAGGGGGGGHGGEGREEAGDSSRRREELRRRCFQGAAASAAAGGGGLNPRRGTLGRGASALPGVSARKTSSMGIQARRRKISCSCRREGRPRPAGGTSASPSFARVRGETLAWQPARPVSSKARAQPRPRRMASTVSVTHWTKRARPRRPSGDDAAAAWAASSSRRLKTAKTWVSRAGEPRSSSPG